ncbi:MAG: hypothetical protein LBD67_00795 [Candidatus Accumulibacter sp.]|nr:hypothetical protein [Accumulibacter sp.]
MLSLSKYERTLRFSSLTLQMVTLRQASFDRLRTEQGKRTGKAFSGQAAFEFKNSLRTSF